MGRIKVNGPAPRLNVSVPLAMLELLDGLIEQANVAAYQGGKHFGRSKMLGLAIEVWRTTARPAPERAWLRQPVGQQMPVPIEVWVVERLEQERDEVGLGRPEPGIERAPRIGIARMAWHILRTLGPLEQWGVPIEDLRAWRDAFTKRGDNGKLFRGVPIRANWRTKRGREMDPFA